MKHIILTLSLAAGLSSNLTADEGMSAPPAREAIEWCDIWISHANETNLPRVLLIGDSIARDYYPEVEKQLAGKAFVGRLATSRFVADPVLLKEIELVLNQEEFDVIVFNNGMHGWQHSEEKYREAFPKLVKTIRALAPQARLIWATTTPLRDGKGVTGDTKAEYSDQRIAARNVAAAEVIAAEKFQLLISMEQCEGAPNSMATTFTSMARAARFLRPKFARRFRSGSSHRKGTAKPECGAALTPPHPCREPHNRLTRTRLAQVLLQTPG